MLTPALSKVMDLLVNHPHFDPQTGRIGRLDRPKAAQALGLKPATFTAHINRLRDMGLVRTEGHGPRGGSLRILGTSPEMVGGESLLRDVGAPWLPSLERGEGITAEEAF